MLFGKQGPTYFGQGLAHCPQRSGLLWAGSGLHLPSLGCFWVGLGYFGEHLPYFAWGVVWSTFLFPLRRVRHALGRDWFTLSRVWFTLGGWGVWSTVG